MIDKLRSLIILKQNLVFDYVLGVVMVHMSTRPRNHWNMVGWIITTSNISQLEELVLIICIPLMFILKQVNVQASVDHEWCSTSFEMGWPGSIPDNKIWKQSHIWIHHHQYFKNGKYILVDKGSYHCILNVCTYVILFKDIHHPLMSSAHLMNERSLLHLQLTKCT